MEVMIEVVGGEFFLVEGGGQQSCRPRTQAFAMLIIRSGENRTVGGNEAGTAKSKMKSYKFKISLKPLPIFYRSTEC